LILATMLIGSSRTVLRGDPLRLGRLPGVAAAVAVSAAGIVTARAIDRHKEPIEGFRQGLDLFLGQWGRLVCHDGRRTPR